MFSHVTVGITNLQAATEFYDAILLPLGLVQRHVAPDGGPKAACWVSPNHSLTRFYVYMPFNRQPATAGNGSMTAFLAPSRAAVDRSYSAGLNAGGRDDGAPGERTRYGAGYYGTYIRDPDGNKIHIVYRGDLLEDTWHAV